MHDKNSPITQAIKANPEKAFDAAFTPKSEEPPYPKEGERFGEGMWYEQIFPVLKDGCHHVTQTWINAKGEVTRAFSNSCGGITFAPGVTRTDGYGERWCPWDAIFHFVDAWGNRYEKEVR